MNLIRAKDQNPPISDKIHGATEKRSSLKSKRLSTPHSVSCQVNSCYIYSLQPEVCDHLLPSSAGKTDGGVLK